MFFFFNKRAFEFVDCDCCTDVFSADHNELGDEAGKAIGEALKVNSSIEKIV